MMPQGRPELDVVVVGAGFAGLYMLHKLRSLGFAVRVIEAGSDVGGTWYWNRYPGARCDVESVDYSYSFSPELEQEWHWSSRYATQPEILAYLRHVADRFSLRSDIKFDTRVVAMSFDDTTARWTVQNDRGDELVARFCVMATGSLSTTQLPDLPGLADFRGDVYHTGSWPGPVDFKGRRVGVVGTGSSGIQLIPPVAAEAQQLIVFQRTPNFTLPANDGPISPELEAEFKRGYRTRRENARHSVGGIDVELPTFGPFDVSEEKRTAILEAAWREGGSAMQIAFGQIYVDDASNAVVADFIRSKVREIVTDPEVSAIVSPRGHPFGSKRVCKDTLYYETFNRDNVRVVDLTITPLVGLSESTVRTTREEFELDSIIFATGFDAFTGTLLRIDITGRDGIRLADEWLEGPKTYLGLMIAGFPNMFCVAGPGSPSVLSNVVVSIEQHVEWIADTLDRLRADGHATMEADRQAQTEWVAHVGEVAAQTLFMKASSWYLGANVPGKPRVFMPYPAGVGRYREICDDVAAEGYRGFVLSGAVAAASEAAG